MSGHVLVLTSTWPRWDGDSTPPFVPELTGALVADGWTATVLAPHAAGAAREETVGGVRVRRFRYAWPERAQTLCYDGGALANLRARPWAAAAIPGLVAAQWRAARRLLADGDGPSVDVLHAHWLVPQGAVATHLPGGPPVVTTVHGGDVFALDQAPVRRVKRRALQRASAVTVNSSATRQAVADLGAPMDRVHTLPMGIDLGAFSTASGAAAPDDRVRLVLVGRLVPEKGVFDALDAVARASVAHPELHLTVVGDGPERSRVEQRSAAEDLAGRVDVVGWQPRARVAEHLARADIALAPSRTSEQGWVEAQGLTIVEAMASGCAVVASDSGGIGDAVTNGETGVLVPEGDAGALAVAISRLAADPDERARLGAAAAHRAQHTYSLDAVADRFSALFGQVTRT